MSVDDIAKIALLLLRLGAVARFIYCMIKIMGNEDEAQNYKKRARNVLIFWVLAESIWVLRDLALHYYT